MGFSESVCVRTVLILVAFLKVTSGEPYNIKEFYDGCNQGNCLKTDADGNKDCSQDTCIAAVHVKKQSGNKFDLSILFKTDNLGYAGAGIGKTKFMVKLAGFECVKPKAAQAKGYTSWITSRITPTRELTNPVITETIKFPDNHVLCIFSVPSKFSIGGETFSLDTTKYHLSLVQGQTQSDSEDNLRQHERFMLSELISFTVNNKDTGASSGAPPTAKKVHGVLMTFMYMGFMPIATIISRFYKETWSSIRIFKKKLWFSIHVGLIYAAVLLGVIGYLVIALVYEQWWPSSPNSQNHALVGSISLGLLVLQATIPWTIPASNISLKTWYYKFHVIIGFICYILGILNIALASFWVPSHTPCSGFFILMLWIASHVAFYILLSTQMLITDAETEGKLSFCPRALISYPIKVHSMEDAPGKWFRILVLISLSGVSLALCSAMSGIIFLGKPCY